MLVESNYSGPLGEGSAEGGGGGEEAAEGFQDGALLFACRRDDSTGVAEGFRVLLAAEGAADFLAHFHRADVALGLVVVVGIKPGVVEVAEDLFPMFAQPVEQVEGFPSRDPPFLAFRFGRGFGVDVVATADDVEVTPEDFIDPAFSDDAAASFFPGQFAFGEVFRFQEKFDHFSGPVLVELLEKIGEFALVVRVAQSVPAVGEGEVGSEAVVDEEVFI